MKKPASPIFKILFGLLAFVLYQALVNWPPVSVASLFRMPLETWLLLGFVGLASFSAKRVSWPVVLLAAAWAALLFIYEHTARLFETYFGRPFDMKFDFWMGRDLINLIFYSNSRFVAFLILGGAALALLLLLAVFVFLTAQSGKLIARPRGLALWFIGGGILALLTGPFEAQEGEDEGTRLRSLRLIVGLAEVINFQQYQDEFDVTLLQAASDQTLLPSDLSLLRGKDVFVIYLESYGRCIWDAPSYREVLAPRMLAFQEALEDSGYSIASRFVASPAFGGGSWLAHATFLSGIWTENNLHWERLLQSTVTPMPAYFKRLGYTTVNVMPAMNVDEWPEGAYFQFDHEFWRKDFKYEHHGYDWSPMPDQFVFFRFDENFLQEEAPPTFGEFVLTSSHVPFSAIPPFHEGEWNYEDLMWTLRNRPMQLFKENTYQALPQDVEGYSAAITYSLASVIDFLLHRYEREAVIFLMGDHQPLSIMDGTETNQVPLHVISRETSITQRYIERGFTPGWFPREDQEIFFLNEFLPLFLELSSDPQRPEAE